MGHGPEAAEGTITCPLGRVKVWASERRHGSPDRELVTTLPRDYGARPGESWGGEPYFASEGQSRLAAGKLGLRVLLSPVRTLRGLIARKLGLVGPISTVWNGEAWPREAGIMGLISLSGDGEARVWGGEDGLSFGRWSKKWII